jgi:hypothetical protein
MMEAVHRYEGTGIMALFAAPLRREREADGLVNVTVTLRSGRVELWRQREVELA